MPHASLSAAASLSAWSDSTAGSSLCVAGGSQWHPILARNDVDVQVKYDLTAGRLVELLDSQAVGGKAVIAARAIVCVVLMSSARASGAISRIVRDRRLRNDQRVARRARHDVEKGKAFVVLVNLMGR